MRRREVVERVVAIVGGQRGDEPVHERVGDDQAAGQRREELGRVAAAGAGGGGRVGGSALGAEELLGDGAAALRILRRQDDVDVGAEAGEGPKLRVGTDGGGERAAHRLLGERTPEQRPVPHLGAENDVKLEAGNHPQPG